MLRATLAVKNHIHSTKILATASSTSFAFRIVKRIALHLKQYDNGPQASTRSVFSLASLQ